MKMLDEVANSTQKIKYKNNDYKSRLQGFKAGCKSIYDTLDVNCTIVITLRF